MIILDTNVVSAMMRDPMDGTVRDWLDAQPLSSVWTTSVTVLEIRFGIERLVPGRRRERLALALTRILDVLAGRVVHFGEAEATETAALMARREKVGRTGELTDSMIAGIAKARKAKLATGNTRHFDDAGLHLIDPWNL